MILDDLLTAPQCDTTPGVCVVIEFEQPPAVLIRADTPEDEHKARHWLATSSETRRVLEGLLAGEDVPRRIRPVTRSLTP